MRLSACLAFSLLGIAGRASAQRFGFVHPMLPADADDSRAVALGDLDGDGDLDALVGNSDFTYGSP
ncbi:MAG TPA: hypothetical protein VKF62_05970, partial [Planctomycetota bacterium]|nr:hypothetical protein [Planctomycetota bacterium]